MISDDRIKYTDESLWYRFVQKIRRTVSKKKRRHINEQLRKQLNNSDVTIISQNCAGGTLYHSLNLPFLSPTINLCFDGQDFVRFASNLKYYLSLELQEIKTKKRTCPVGRLDDVDVYFVHYRSFEEAKRKWDQRRARVNYDNILVIATDRDGMLLDESFSKFDKIPYTKVMYTAKSYDKYPWAANCDCWKKRETVGIISGIADLSGHLYYEKYSDIISLINMAKP